MHERPTGRLKDQKPRASGRATVAVYRALATAPGRAPAGGAPLDNVADWNTLTAEMPTKSNALAMARWRGRVDALALLARYSDATCDARYRPAPEPAKTLFSLLEQARVETLGARQYPGMRDNLAALADERWSRSRPEAVIRDGGIAWVEPFALLARIPLTAPLPAGARAMAEGSWRKWMTASQVAAIEALVASLEDQEAFAIQSIRVIGTVLGVISDPTSTLQRTKSADSREADQVDRPRATPGRSAESAPASSGLNDSVISFGPLESGSDPSEAKAAERSPAAYRAYTTAFDRVAGASDLCDSPTLVRARQLLDQCVGSRVLQVTRWAHRLQRTLMALQMRSWQFDREEGLLDVSRLTRVATHPLAPLLFKQEREVEFPDTVVTLLVDESGSMRGSPIATAAVCAELLGRVLERCGVKTEILGFTTNCWRGGRARQRWVLAGKPAMPGRLTEVLHIIYKSADEPWRRARNRLGVMCQDEVLKENIDGEALLWAHERLLGRREPRKILMVVSDGAPLDETTLEANDPHYLDRHLRIVIKHIERLGAVELAAIGIGHDVSRFYRRALTISSVDELGEAMVGQLIELFSPPQHRRGMQTRRPKSEHASSAKERP